MLKQRYQFLHKGSAALEYVLTSISHLHLQHPHQLLIGFLFLLEHGVSLLQHTVVLVECFNIVAVVLCDDNIHQFSALLATSVDKQGV